MSRDSANLTPGLAKHHCGGCAPDRQPTCRDQAPAAVSAAPGQHHDVSPGHLPAQPAAGMGCQAPSGVLHHLQQRDVKFVGHDPVDLSHLCDGHRRDDVHTVLTLNDLACGNAVRRDGAVAG